MSRMTVASNREHITRGELFGTVKTEKQKRSPCQKSLLKEGWFQTSEVHCNTYLYPFDMAVQEAMDSTP
jgi:hypothetical protein